MGCLQGDTGHHSLKSGKGGKHLQSQLSGHPSKGSLGSMEAQN